MVRYGPVFDVGTSIGIVLAGAFVIILITTVISVLIAVIFRFSSKKGDLTLQTRNKDTSTKKYCNKDGSIRNVELNGNDCYGICDRPITPENTDDIYIGHNISYRIHKSGVEESDYTEIRT